MKTKIKVKDKVYELTDCCRWEVRDGVLWNLNTNHDEGVDGDIITYNCGNGEIKTGTIEGYTCYQFVSTKEHGNVILSAHNYNVSFVHNMPVSYYTNDTEEVKTDELVLEI
jgi:hypothetical protein